MSVSSLRRLCDESAHEVQRGDRRAAADHHAVAWEVEAERTLAHRAAGGQEDEPDRLVLAAAAGAGDAGDRDRDVDTEARACTLRHRRRNLGGDRAVLSEHDLRHAELTHLAVVAVWDDVSGHAVPPPGIVGEARVIEAAGPGPPGSQRGPA